MFDGLMLHGGYQCLSTCAGVMVDEARLVVALHHGRFAA